MLQQFDWRMRALRTMIRQERNRHRFQLEVERRHARHEKLKLVIGAGTSEPFIGAAETPYEGWLITDVKSLDALNQRDWSFYFPTGSIDRILAEHVIEHWTEDQLRTFLKIVLPFLSPEGMIRIAVPDGYHHDPAYIESVKPGGIGPGADDHKVLFNYQTLSSLLSEANWRHDLLEYFDEQGQFHRTPWSEADGFIERSQRHDSRNRERPLCYTSLIVDLRPQEARGKVMIFRLGLD